VSVKLDKKSNTGDLACKVCGQTYQTGINYLSQAVDVYSDWIDACDAVAKEAADGAGTATGRPMGAAAAADRGGVRETGVVAQRKTDARREETYDDDDGFVENDELDGEAEYGGDD